MNSKVLESEGSLSGPAVATGQSRRRIVAVFGGTVPDAILALAEELGREIARRGEILLTGGSGPGAPDPQTVKNSAIKGAQTVKNSAIKGAQSSPWIGIVRKAPWNSFSKPPGGFLIESPLRHRRNYLEAWMCDAAIVLKGDTGTKSELGSALALRRRVVLVGENWRDFHAGLRETPAAMRSRLAKDTNDKFGNEADRALGYDPVALTTALEQATQPLNCEWLADNATAAAIVDAALVDTPALVSLTGRFPEALDGTVAANYEAWLGTLGALPLATGTSASIPRGVHVKRIDVVKTGGHWVGRSGGKTVRGTKATSKKETVKKAIAVAKNAPNPTSVRIHKSDGQIQEERTYPRSADPKKSAG